MQFQIEGMTEVIRGMGIKHNKNGIIVAEIGYEADPEKDPETEAGRKWLEEYRLGFSPSMWEKEMERDFQALLGKLVYENWNRTWHVCKRHDPPEKAQRFMSVDPGLANPCAVIWAYVVESGDVTIYDEYYAVERSVPEHASAIRSKEAMSSINWRVMDAAAWARNQTDKRSVSLEWERQGFFFKKGSRDEEAGILVVREYLHYISELGIIPNNPRLRVCENCEHTIWEFEHWKYPEQSAEVAERKNPAEKPEDKNNHCMDAIRIMLHERPAMHHPGGLPQGRISRRQRRHRRHATFPVSP